MAKKRGGIAGFYDKFKTPIRYGATIGATLLGGPGAGAATNAAFRGFDRPGQRGIGFDPVQGGIGALEGYTMGKGVDAAKGMFTGAQYANRMANATNLINQANTSMGIPVPTGVPSVPGGGSLMDRAAGLFGGMAKGSGKSDMDILTGVAKGLYGVRQGQQANDLARDKIAVERESLAQGQRQFDATLALKEKDFAIAAAQEADRKRREEELMAQRARVRALFGGA